MYNRTTIRSGGGGGGGGYGEISMRDSLLYLCPWCSYTGMFVDEKEPRMTTE